MFFGLGPKALKCHGNILLLRTIFVNDIHQLACKNAWSGWKLRWGNNNLALDYGKSTMNWLVQSLFQAYNVHLKKIKNDKFVLKRLKNGITATDLCAKMKTPHNLLRFLFRIL